MFTSINADNFDSKILSEKRPVLLAYICRDYGYKSQIEILKDLSENNKTIKICLLDENLAKTYLPCFRETILAKYG